MMSRKSYITTANVLGAWVIIARNGLSCMLMDNRSSNDMLFGNAFYQIPVDHPWVSMAEPLYDSLRYFDYIKY